MWLKGSYQTSLATLAHAMGCSELNLPVCDTRLRSLMPVSAFRATKYDKNQNLFPLVEIFPCGFEGFLYRLRSKTARHTQDL